MTQDPKRIEEIDLLAYSDGLLEGDLVRKNQVEAYLARNPRQAERVENYVQQNQAIRALYSAKQDGRTPQRFADLLNELERPRRVRTSAMVAAVLMSVLAGGVGWMLGRSNDLWQRQEALPMDFLTTASEHPVRNKMSFSNVAGVSNPASLSQPDSVWLEIPSPDLSEIGFALVDRQQFRFQEREAIRLTYRSADDAFSLFVTLRRKGQMAFPSVSQNSGFVVSRWAEPPFEFALVERAQEIPTERLVEMVRRAVKRPHLQADPPPNPYRQEGPAMAGDGGIGNGSMGTLPQIPGLPQKFN